MFVEVEIKWFCVSFARLLLSSGSPLFTDSYSDAIL